MLRDCRKKLRSNKPKRLKGKKRRKKYYKRKQKKEHEEKLWN